jgi:photosynthetic reaction center H subunit
MSTPITDTERVENVSGDPALVPVDSHPGAALEPLATVNPMLAGVGPGAWADRADRLDVTVDGDPKIRPLRAAPGFAINRRDPNPVGMPVIAMDGVEAGIIREAWVDISELQIRYLEVEVHGSSRRVLLPMPFARVKRDGVRVKSIAARHFADVPATRHPDYITLLEEDKISAYYGAGYLYASPDRMGPIL